jgi:acetyl-CoA carboxylase/biotin carboxylase 1
MKAKGVIRDSLEWRNSRRFFYWRIRRRLNEEYILRRMVTSIIPPSSAAVVSDMKARQLREHNLRVLATWAGIADFEHNDRAVAEWYEVNRKTISDKVEAMRAENLAAEISSVVRSNKTAGLRGLRDVLRTMPVDEREQVLKFLRE